MASDSGNSEMGVLADKYVSELAELARNPLPDLLFVWGRTLAGDFSKIIASKEEDPLRWRACEAMRMFVKYIYDAHHSKIRSNPDEHGTTVNIGFQKTLLEMKIDLKLTQRGILKM